MGDVVILPVMTKLNCPLDRVLNGALEADLEDAVIIGWTKDGGFYFASSKSSGSEILWLLKLAEKHLMEIGAGE